METFDVGVVGAGVHGASAAFHLASRGMSVVIFERWTPAGGPTGRSSAVCRAYYTNTFLAAAARDSIEMMANFREITGVDAGFRKTGMLFLHPPEDVNDVEASAERLNQLGIATSLFDPGRFVQTYPSFDGDGIGVAALERDAGYADPHATTEGLFRRAVELGAVGRMGVQVVKLEPSERGVIVTTDDGTQRSCGRVLIAAGPWTGPLAAQVGADLPLTVERHVVATFRWAGADPTPAHGDLIGGYYFRPEGEDLYLVGPSIPPRRPTPTTSMRRSARTRFAGSPRRWFVACRSWSAPRSTAGGRACTTSAPIGNRSSARWRPTCSSTRERAGTDSSSRPRSANTWPTWSQAPPELDPRLKDFDPFRFTEGKPLPAGYREARILG